MTLACAATVLLAGGCDCCKSTPEKDADKVAPPVAAAKVEAPALDEPQILFDGKTMGKWKATEFGGQAEVKIKDGAFILPIGNDMTGVNYTGQIPRVNYELSLDAMRMSGGDFFCGLTFPVNDSNASLILGGWGGTVCGISCIDGYDASDNSTTAARSFKDNQWYHVRMRVQGDRLTAWLDEEELVDVSTVGKKLSVRGEVEESRPLGIATWRTTGAIKNIKVRLLKPEEIVPKKDDI